MSRHVVVTGASRGIGRAIVQRFAALGDDVVAVARSQRELRELATACGGTVRAAPCDLTDEAAVRGLFEATGEVDVLVNNAGVADSAPLHETTLAAWDEQMAVNATAPFLCVRAVIAGMRERGAGRIVTVASIAGRVGAPYAAAYSASKHAAIGLTRSAAAELAGTGVTANAVCPAFVDTAMTHRAARTIARRTGRTESESVDSLAGLSPLQRLIDPDEVADSVVWLASAAAGAINGQAIVIDGGGVQT